MNIKITRCSEKIHEKEDHVNLFIFFAFRFLSFLISRPLAALVVVFILCIFVRATVISFRRLHNVTFLRHICLFHFCRSSSSFFDLVLFSICNEYCFRRREWEREMEIERWRKNVWREHIHRDCRIVFHAAAISLSSAVRWNWNKIRMYIYKFGRWNGHGNEEWDCGWRRERI